MPTPTTTKPSSTSILRSTALYLTEPHPYNRKPITSAPASIPWANYPRRVGRTGTFVLPLMVLVLGWPLAGKWVFDGRM
ncbi:hypothetical protein DM02DRAFT_530318 [Periconia macrospinosa]|uniref:Uncharacterized protein n=1 Tax=Periconia macrospinosa TaxID=97972 RepID=A0A2V1DL20_9PLEO|nr:hypothetical protein DM02DRAFT_530318 [Periconia macrospinosa]